MYINGVKWKKADLLNKYLFKNGEVNAETGNFYCYETGNENGVKSGGCVVEATCLHGYTSTPNSYLKMCTNNAIDISEYSKLYLEYQVVSHVNSSYDSVNVWLGSSKEGNNILSKSVSSEIGTHTAEIDLTNTTAEVAYVMILTNYVAKIYVYKIWFEK